MLTHQGEFIGGTNSYHIHVQPSSQIVPPLQIRTDQWRQCSAI